MQRWQYPEWPATCWCWNLQSVCPCSSVDQLAHWQTQEKHTGSRLSDTAVHSGVEKKTKPQQWSTRGRFCQRVKWEEQGGEIFCCVFEFAVLPSCQINQVYPADYFWGQVVLQGCLKGKKTGQATMRICRTGFTTLWLRANAWRSARDDLCVLDGEDGVRSATGVVVVCRRRDAVGDSFLQKIDGLLAVCDDMLRQIWRHREEQDKQTEDHLFNYLDLERFWQIHSVDWCWVTRCKPVKLFENRKCQTLLMLRAKFWILLVNTKEKLK